MPIDRVPIIHKFGIISLSQRAELEERIAQKAFSETRHKIISQQALSRTLPFEVTEDFVYKFNDSSQEERRKLEDTAFKMLKRLKRLVGLRDAGEVHHADLPRAWVDLALLAQCRYHKLEDACLETLIASIDQASVAEEHILSLFYLAKSGVHWLKRDSLNEAVLRSTEVKLLKMTRLVFQRLYCHYLLGQLQEYEVQQASLAQYLKGFSEKENCYNQFPGAELSIRFIIECGGAICTLSKSVACQDYTLTEQPASSENTLHEVQLVDGQDAGPVNASHFVRNAIGGPRSSNFTFLWHCINVWYVVNNDELRVDDALYDLFQNTSHLAHEPWLDIAFAFYILTDASRHNTRVLNAFQHLISIDFSTISVPVDAVPLCETCYSSFSNTREKKICNSILTGEDSPSCNFGSDYQGSISSPNVIEKLKSFVDCGNPGDTKDYLGMLLNIKNQPNAPTSRNSARQEHTWSSCSREDRGYSGTVTDIDAVTQARGNMGEHDANCVGKAVTSGDLRNVKIYDDIRSSSGTTKSVEIEGSSEKTHGIVDTSDFSNTNRTTDEVENKRNNQIKVNENDLVSKLNGVKYDREKSANRLTSVETVGKNSESSLIQARKNGPTEKQHDTQNSCTDSSSIENILENSERSQVQSMKKCFSSRSAAEQYDTQKRCVNLILAETIMEGKGSNQTAKAEENISSASYSITNPVEAQKPGHHWPWELLYTFCECMTTICLYGISSNIQKIALVGDENRCKTVQRYGNSVNSKYGLVDLIEYGRDLQNQDDWRIRYAVVQSLVQVYRHHYGDLTKEGITNAAWTLLMHCQTKERDGRVMDAIKVGKVEADLQNNLAEEYIPVSLCMSKIAVVLSQTFHPSKVCLATPTPPPISTAARSVNKLAGKAVKAKDGSSTKPSLRQEISLSNACRAPRMGYAERMNLQLRTVVEDQWKKQLLEEMEEELKTNVGELEKSRNEELLKSQIDTSTMS